MARKRRSTVWVRLGCASIGLHLPRRLRCALLVSAVLSPVTALVVLSGCRSGLGTLGALATGSSRGEWRHPIPVRRIRAVGIGSNRRGRRAAGAHDWLRSHTQRAFTNQMIVDLESSPATIPAIPSYHPQIDFLSYLLPSPSVGKERRHDCKTREGTCRGPPLGVLSLISLGVPYIEILHSVR